MALPPDPRATGGLAPSLASSARRRRRWLVPLAVSLVLVLVAVAALVVHVAIRPDRERRANIRAVATAFDDCDLGLVGANIDRDDGFVDFGEVGAVVGPSWGDVACLADALEMPRECLTELQAPGDGLDQEEYRWGAYMALRMRTGSETHVSVYHDWWAKPYER